MSADHFTLHHSHAFHLLPSRSRPLLTPPQLARSAFLHTQDSSWLLRRPSSASRLSSAPRTRLNATRLAHLRSPPLISAHLRSPSRPSAASRTLCECVMCSCVSCARQQVPQRTSSSSLTSSSRAMCLVCGDASASDELCVVRRRCDSGKLLRDHRDFIDSPRDFYLYLSRIHSDFIMIPLLMISHWYRTSSQALNSLCVKSQKSL